MARESRRPRRARPTPRVTSRKRPRTRARPATASQVTPTPSVEDDRRSAPGTAVTTEGPLPATGAPSEDGQFVPRPVFRKLRVFAVDPGMTARFETALLNEMTLAIPWEDLAPGPVGEYVAVVDQDDKGTQLHHPVDLDRADIVGQEGLAPSDGNPQFRQQMVYAVAMRTIRNFERALGRVAHWPPRATAGIGGQIEFGVYESRLRMYPHFMREHNAYYDPRRGFCFGYFPSIPGSPFPGTCIFTALSQDIIAHELTHALLLGMKIEFLGPHPDVAAFHEAFADLIPLFQHFWKSDVLRAQIAAVRGNLGERSALGAVALQFGQGIGQPDGLRNALGSTDEEGRWQPRRPDPKLYQTEEQPHARGDILVGAVFQAFVTIYESRVADLRRIATKGTGVLAPGTQHPDLINRFTDEASTVARHVLDMCIRALDYIPPVDITFGDFLRAIVTADYDIDPRDERNYRIAFLEAFRNNGIFPSEVGTLSVDTLLWPRPPSDDEARVLEAFVQEVSAKHNHWNLPRGREQLWRTLDEWRRTLHEYLTELAAGGRSRLGVIDLRKPFQVVSLHPRERAGLHGELTSQWVVKLQQRSGSLPVAGEPGGPFRLAGCTLLVDGDTGLVRYQISKELVAPPPKGRPRPTDLLQRAGTGVAPLPTERRLRVFAFDPSLGVQLETAVINEVTLRVPWERNDAGHDILEPGPVGEYLEVVDRDPASGCFYAPINLNHPHLLAQEGLAPSESNPQFHQQMVYAVAMRAIRTFERALGRLALWSPRHTRTVGAQGENRGAEEYVQRLRIYPHALREANAYYSPSRKALLFGYFPAAAVDDASAARLTVFTCLSHDIVAHEVTHALLDGMHRRFNEPSNPDVLAFHEAFADLVALLLHFSLPDALRHQIAATRGDLASQNRLGELAQQFGQAIGKRGALRSAIGAPDPQTGQWKPLDPDPEAHRRVMEPHERGAILVAAVFDAFLTIYKSRVADLLRIASEGTGVLPAGQLHPDLVNRLADEAARSARHVLDMCIRALDYCPPVDITFGDYLRAIVTADFEYNPVDEDHRRVAFAEAFRRRGIVPEEVRTLSVDGLLWRPTSAAPDEDENVVLSLVKSWTADVARWSLSKSRRELFELTRAKREILQVHIERKLQTGSAVLGGVDPSLLFEVHSLRPSIRTDLEGNRHFQWIIELTQLVGQYLDAEGERPVDARPDYYFRGGCTLVVDGETGTVRYSIKKPLDQARKERQRRYVLEEGNENLAATYLGGVGSDENEPFAVLHRF